MIPENLPESSKYFTTITKNSFSFIKDYNPTIFIIIRYKSTRTNKKDTIKRIRNLGTLNKFLNGAKITKIKPTKLLIKNLGYRDILFQKSLIEKNYNYWFLLLQLYIESFKLLCKSIKNLSALFKNYFLDFWSNLW